MSKQYKSSPPSVLVSGVLETMETVVDAATVPTVELLDPMLLLGSVEMAGVRVVELSMLLLASPVVAGIPRPEVVDPTASDAEVVGMPRPEVVDPTVLSTGAVVVAVGIPSTVAPVVMGVFVAAGGRVPILVEAVADAVTAGGRVVVRGPARVASLVVTTSVVATLVESTAADVVETRSAPEVVVMSTGAAVVVEARVASVEGRTVLSFTLALPVEVVEKSVAGVLLESTISGESVGRLIVVGSVNVPTVEAASVALVTGPFRMVEAAAVLVVRVAKSGSPKVGPSDDIPIVPFAIEGLGVGIAGTSSFCTTADKLVSVVPLELPDFTENATATPMATASPRESPMRTFLYRNALGRDDDDGWLPSDSAEDEASSSWME